MQSSTYRTARAAAALSSFLLDGPLSNPTKRAHHLRNVTKCSQGARQAQNVRLYAIEKGRTKGPNRGQCGVWARGATQGTRIR